MFGSTESVKKILQSKGALRIVEGDVTNPQPNPQLTAPKEVIFIPHCCNNGQGDGVGVMGAGVALALRKKWPEVYEIYKKMESESRNGLTNRLGEICYSRVETTPYDVIVINMIAQDGTVCSGNPHPVKYWALMQCMAEIRMAIGSMMGECSGNKPVIHTCKFGSDLAGGNWEFIMELVREQWLDRGFDVVVYEFKG